MAFPISPGVEVSEVDISTTVPSVATNIGAYSGNFRWGPVNEIMNISNEVDLVRMVGSPDTNTAIDFFSVANFLSYSNNMKVVRAGDLSVLKNAGSNTASQILITNDSNYSANWANGTIESANAAGPFVAKFPGSIGNSLRYSICEANSAAFASWQYASLFANAPETSSHATIRGGSNDELHMVVIDEDGLFTKIPGTVLEKYSNLSRSIFARDDTGKSIYYKTVIENSSKYLRCVSDPERPRPLSTIGWNTGAYSNSGNVWITFNSDGTIYRPGNARVFINATTNAILEVIVYDGGLYSRPPTIISLIAPNGSISANLTANLAPSYIETSSNFANNGGVNWDVKDLRFHNRSKVSGDISLSSIAWKPDGTNYYFLGDAGNTVSQSPVSTPWYAASRTSTRDFNANNITNLNYSSGSQRSLAGLYFKPDGVKFYHGDIATDAAGRRVYEYTMTEAWNVLTASCGTNHFFSTSSQDITSPRDIHFKDDGTRMYILGSANDRIFQYTLSTPWSVNTATATFSASLVTNGVTPANMNATGMHFIKDGTVLVIIDNQLSTVDEYVYQYNLTEAWNVASMSSVRSSAILGELQGSTTPNPSGLYISPNEEDVYISNNFDDRIYHYRLSIGDPNYSGNSSKSYFQTGAYTVSLTGGTDSTLTDANVITGYSYFDNADEVDIGLVVTGNHTTSVENSIINSLGEGRQDCIVFVSPQRTDVVDKYGSEVTNVLTTRNSLTSSTYAFMDSGWKYQYDKYNDIYRWIPLNADVAGICAKTAYSFDEFFSPGGLNRGSINNIVNLAYNPKKADRDLLYIDQVNPVVTFSGTGTVLFGDKTLTSKPSVFDRIGARRLFIMMRKSLAMASKYSLFEINDENTRSQFINIVEPYLRDLQGRRGITNYRVVCDNTNNTPEIIDRNEFVGDIYVKTNRSINYIQLNFVATRTGVSFEEVVGAF
jgi:hypothetical protein